MLSLIHTFYFGLKEYDHIGSELVSQQIISCAALHLKAKENMLQCFQPLI
jgi:hypothetical protein